MWRHRCNPPAAFPLWISISQSHLLVGLKILKPFFTCFSPVSITPSPSAPPVRLCPPLSSPEDAGVNLFTAAGFLSYVQSTTRRAYQQVLEVLDNSHRRWFLFLAPENFQFVHNHKIFRHDINYILMSVPGLDQSLFVSNQLRLLLCSHCSLNLLKRITTLRESGDTLLSPPSRLFLLVSPLFIIKRLLFPLKMILSKGHCGEICDAAHAEAHALFGFTKGAMLNVCVCKSRGSIPKRLKADRSGTDPLCHVQSCELTKETCVCVCIISHVIL